MAEALMMQATAAEQSSLALECLVIIGRRYGLSLTVDHLVKDNKLGSADVATDQLRVCAERAGFRCRSLRARWDLLSKMQGALPAIVRFTDGRHAVLLRVENQGGVQRVLLQQPRPGEDDAAATLDQTSFESVWSGDVLLIKRSLGLAEKERPFGLETIVGMVTADRRATRELLISTAVLSVLALAPIVFAQLLLTYVLSYPASGTFLLLCLGLAIAILFESAFAGLRRSVLGRMSARLEHDLSGYAFERLLHLPITYFERTAVGLTTQRLNQVTTIAASLGSRAVGTVFDIGVAAVALLIMLYDSLSLTGVVLGLAAVTVLWTLFMTARIRVQAAAVEKVEAERSAFVSESIGAFGTVKALSLDTRQRQKWDVLTARVTRLRLAESASVNLLQTVATPLEWLMVFGTFGLGIVLANISGGATPNTPATLGLLFAFLLLTQRVATPIRHLATFVREADEFRRATGTLGLLLNEPVEAGHAGEGVRLPLRGRIDFINVTFSYPGTQTPALQSVSFEVPVGATLGILGRSGSGKSTITRLLHKFHSEYQGLIKIDGIDARDYEMGHLRGSIGVVLQDTFLFSGTIRDNIVAAKPDATDDDIFHAARVAGADAFIERLPLGYETVLKEGAVNLSDGQRQRLAIARAVIGDPRILVLDEATSALDPESEAMVNANLKRFSSGRTTILLSHRFSALANADVILVLDRGEVQDMGNHDELLERCDIYSGLWHRRKNVLAGPSAPETLLPRDSHVA